MVFQTCTFGGGSRGAEGLLGLVFLDTDTLGQGAGRAVIALTELCAPRNKIIFYGSQILH